MAFFQLKGLEAKRNTALCSHCSSQWRQVHITFAQLKFDPWRSQLNWCTLIFKCNSPNTLLPLYRTMAEIQSRWLIDLGLWYSQRCMRHLLSYEWVPLFWNNTMFHLFSIQKPKRPNLTLMKNSPRSTQGHHLNQFGSTQSSSAAYQVSRQSTQQFWRRGFLRFLPYMGIVAKLFLRPGPFEQIFNLPLPGCCIWNLIEIGPPVSKEKLFETVNTLDLFYLWYSQRYKKHLLTYHRLPLFWKNTMFHLFSNQKPKLPNLTFTKNKSRSTQGHHLNKLGSTRWPNATKFQGNQPSNSGEKDFLRFYHIWAMWPSRSWDLDHLNKF